MRRLFVVISCCLAIGLSGCANQEVSSSQTSTAPAVESTPAPQVSTSPSPSSSVGATEVVEPAITMSQAIAIFNQTFPNAQLLEVELDSSVHGQTKYQIEGFSDTQEYELQLSATDGSIIKKEVDSIDAKEHSENVAKALHIDQYISPVAATNAAISKTNISPSDLSLDYELKIDDGQPVYDVDLTTAPGSHSHVKVHAVTADIVHVHQG